MVYMYPSSYKSVVVCNGVPFNRTDDDIRQNLTTYRPDHVPTCLHFLVTYLVDLARRILANAGGSFVDRPYTIEECVIGKLLFYQL